MLESGDDFHLSFEVGYGAGFGLRAGKHEFRLHRIAAGFRGGEMDGPAAAAAEFVGMMKSSRRRGARRSPHGLRRDATATMSWRMAGEVSLWQGGVNHGGVRRGFQTSFDGRLAG